MIKSHINIFWVLPDYADNKFVCHWFCGPIFNFSIALDGVYFIDPDGPTLGHDAFKVFCNFTSGMNNFHKFKWQYDKSLQFLMKGQQKCSMTLNLKSMWNIAVTQVTFYIS